MKRQSLVCSLFAMLLVVSCTKKPSDNPLAYIPAKAKAVVAFDLKRLTEKADVNCLLTSGTLSSLSFMMTRIMGLPDVLNDRSVTGVDFDRHAYFVQPDTGHFNAYFIIPLLDAGKLETFIRSYDKSIKLEEGDGFIWFEEFAWVAGHNRKVLVAIPQGEVAMLKTIFKTKPKDALLKADNDLRAWLDEPNDITLWADLNVPISDVPEEQGNQWQLGESLRGSVLMIALNFHNGFAEAHAVIQPGDGASGLFNALSGTGSDQMHKYLLDSAFLWASVNVNTSALKDWLESSGSMTKRVGKTDMTWSEILDVFNPLTGQAVVSLSEPYAVESYGSPVTTSEALVAVGIKERALVLEVLQLALTDRLGFALLPAGSTTEMTDDAILIASSKDILTSKRGEVPDDVRELLQQPPVALYMDFAYFSEVLLSVTPQSAEDVINLSATFADIAEAITLAAATDKGELHVHLKLHTYDDTENSLHLLIRAVAEGFGQMMPF